MKKAALITSILCSVYLPAWAQEGTLPPHLFASPSNPYYIEGNAGASLQDWSPQSLVETMTGSTADTISQKPSESRLSYGLNAGWIFAHQFALELGWYQQASTSIKANRVQHPTFTVQGHIHSWLSYLACRLTMFTNMDRYFNLFAKLGISYNDTQLVWQSAAPGEKTNAHVDGIIGLGASLKVNKQFYLGAQALYTLSNTQHIPTPANTMILATIGFQF